MKKHLRRILSLLCVLALAFGTAAATAEGNDVQMEDRVITVLWKDGNNRDGLRPDPVYAYLAGEKATLTEQNGWTATVSVPSDTDNNWTYDAIEGYSANLDRDAVSVLTYTHAVAEGVSRTGEVAWDDGQNTKAIRPESMQIMLMADQKPYGEPATVSASTGWQATWKDLPKTNAVTGKEIVYSVKQLQDPQGYSASVSGMKVTNTLQMSRLTLDASVSGAPDGTDLSAVTVTVDGPDPDMPKTLPLGSHDFGDVLPGAYLAYISAADGLAEGYTMDTANSRIADAIYAKAGEPASLSVRYTYMLPEAVDAEEDYDPEAGIGELTFRILGPDARMPVEVPYSAFTNGTFEISDLVPGVYTVVELNAETLVKYYTLTSDSRTGMVLEVGGNGTATAKLYNQYVPAPTPEPDAEFVDISVTKTWNDNNNRDGNRPESITVRLYADGVETDSHVLTAAEKWSYTFTEKPRYQEDHLTEIVYTIGEDSVAMYDKTINGYNIVNDYRPEVTSRSVAKIWADNNNAQKIRPASIAMTLSDGQKTVTTVVLNEDNNWFATVNNLPTVVNGKPAVYSWKEQAVIGYQLTGAVEKDGITTFTNAIWTRTETPPPGRKPKTPGEVVTIEEYDTPLGVEIVINHVGDCFD